MASEAPLEVPARNGGGAGRMPYRLWIGVTGHRNVPDDPGLRDRIREVLAQIQESAPHSLHTDVCWGVISALAEGADRLVAREILKDERAALEAPLPRTLNEYIKDFQSAASQEEFHELLQRASLINLLPTSRSRNVGYAQVGEYVVERSDVLIAIWDGEGSHGQGGTADVVGLARSRSVPLFWIYSEPGYEIQRQPGRGVPVQPFEELDAYNRTRISTARLKLDIERRDQRWSQAATYAGLPAHQIRPYLRWILPYLARADLLASRYQSYYLWFGTVLFTLAALAVAAAAVQILSPSRLTNLAWVEACFMILAIVVMVVGRWMRVHDRWISYRSLAERFRLAFFLHVVGLGTERIPSAAAVRSMGALHDWTSRSFDEVWMVRPKGAPPASSLDALKRFLSEAWIDDQMAYYQRASRKDRRREWLFSAIVIALFVSTLLVAVIHGLEPMVHGLLHWPAEWLILLAILLPAAAGAAGGIQAQREYDANAVRFGHMAQRLSAIRQRIDSAPDLDTLQAVAELAATAMLEEHRGWFGMMRAHAFRLHELV